MVIAINSLALVTRQGRLLNKPETETVSPTINACAGSISILRNRNFTLKWHITFSDVRVRHLLIKKVLIVVQ